jgi:DNA-directed RNA polymerase I subunit RPA2
LIPHPLPSLCQPARRAACIEYLGSLFRAALDAPPRRTDYQVGEMLLRELLFIHLDQPADKLQLAVQMLLKLYALVGGGARGAGGCSDDAATALRDVWGVIPGGCWPAVAVCYLRTFPRDGG